jgi:hypothetical protein
MKTFRHEPPVFIFTTPISATLFIEPRGDPQTATSFDFLMGLSM